MQKEILIAGFGGQGVLFAGQVLAYAAMDAGRVVTWIPSYGPEMRGGTANCTVVIADEEIGSPLVKHPPVVIALNLPSFDKYEALVQPGGMLVVNQSMVDRAAKRSDITVVFVPGNEIAEETGDRRLLNMVMVGALLAAFPELQLDDVKAALKAHLPEKHQKLLPNNFAAMDKGYEVAKGQLETAAV
ncbi:MAG: NADH-dependent phenylglyoxylate dehydrogenase subunit gamma [Anaerolineales bacterium]|nr:NADH-dependent phenylglyoxylate dehydrogenase subunit gamma [Anaerolineales bacterium]